MISISDPSELKPADVYKQARLVASKTSRASDKNWYKDALDLPWQWHLWFDGGREVTSATFSRSDHTWRQGPEIPLSNLTTSEGSADLMGELLSTRFFAQKPSALGIVLHVADEFALAGLAQATGTNTDAAEDLDVIKYNLIDDPRECLADREVAVESTSWRLLPFWGAVPGQPRATAIALSRSRELFLHDILTHGEELHVPIRIAVTAAAVEQLAALPLLEPSMTGGRLIVLPYLKYTVVFALSPEGELRGLRSLAHRGGANVPSGLPDILSSMAISAELSGVGPGSKPKVLVASPDAQVIEAATRALVTGSISGENMDIQSINLSTHPALAAIPGRRPEFLVYDAQTVEAARAAGGPLVGTQTFTALWKDWLTSSNFFDTIRMDALYPTLRDLQLLRFATGFSLLMVLAFIGAAAFGGYSFWKASTHPSWNLTPDQLKKTESKQVTLQQERRQIDVANRLLLPRSCGWSTLEFLLQLFPEDAGVRLDSFEYGLETARLGAGAGKGKPVESAGLVRTWTVRGLAESQALELLNAMNSQRGLTAFFERVAKATGDASYGPDPTRQLTIALTQGRNPRFVADPASSRNPTDPTATFPFSFEATISQTLSDKDTLALPNEKPF